MDDAEDGHEDPVPMEMNNLRKDEEEEPENVKPRNSYMINALVILAVFLGFATPVGFHMAVLNAPETEIKRDLNLELGENEVIWGIIVAIYAAGAALGSGCLSFLGSNWDRLHMCHHHCSCDRSRHFEMANSPGNAVESGSKLGNSTQEYWAALLNSMMLMKTSAFCMMLLLYKKGKVVQKNIEPEETNTQVVPLSEVENERNTAEEASRSNESTTKRSCLRKNLINLNCPILHVLILNIGQQLSGINAVIFYSTFIFTRAGLRPSWTQFASLAVGVTNMVALLIFMPIQARLPRRLTLLTSLIGCIVFLSVLALSFILPEFALFSLVSVILYIVSFQAGLGPLPHFIGIEIAKHPESKKLLAFGSLANWTAAFVVGLGFPVMESRIGATATCFVIRSDLGLGTNDVMWGCIVAVFLAGGALGSGSLGIFVSKISRKVVFSMEITLSLASGGCFLFAKPSEIPAILILGRLLAGIAAGNNLMWPYLLVLPLVLKIPCFIGLLFCPDGSSRQSSFPTTTSKAALCKNQSDTTLDEETRSYSIEDDTPGVDSFLKHPVVLVVLLNVGQQMSGINVVFFYSTKLFSRAGLSPFWGQVASLGMGVANAVALYCFMPLVANSRRRLTLLVSIAACALCLAALATCLAFPELGNLSIAATFLYIVSFTVGIGPVPLFFGNEVSKPSERPRLLALGTLANWFTAFFIGLVFPVMETRIGATVGVGIDLHGTTSAHSSPTGINGRVFPQD
ncbi:unnamed protein product [Notodromas monacha]|uniref:Major facilitator superfamily (MFS) profile domain-containing protein n=1 Tax=Notodromas monacha TaxID=399045 RepID=A0A7R9BS86_9CRUS|nr:unnamed protein product [Notodromas monacha]CAG0920734.1 unnamed protein product [Notodromas monacha]